jgi:hypothetical protein
MVSAYFPAVFRLQPHPSLVPFQKQHFFRPALYPGIRSWGVVLGSLREGRERLIVPKVTECLKRYDFVAAI